MGNAVTVGWIDGPTVKEVEAFTGKYQYGHFDGMNDMYENSNKRTDLPQAKFVRESRQYSEAVRSQHDHEARYNISFYERPTPVFSRRMLIHYRTTPRTSFKILPLQIVTMIGFRFWLMFVTVMDLAESLLGMDLMSSRNLAASLKTQLMIGKKLARIGIVICTPIVF